MPHRGELGVSEDDVDDAGTMNRRVGVDRSSDLLDAAHDDGFLLWASSDNRVASSTLTVETEVLSEGLEEHHVVAVLREEFEREAILLEVTAGKALISTVKCSEHLFALDDLENFLPLGRCGVNTGWVVSADMEHDKGVVLSVVEVFLKAIEVEALCGWVIVAIVGPVLIADNISDGSVNGPGRVGDKEVNVLVRVPRGEELKAEAE